MKIDKERVKILGLSRKEIAVIEGLRAGNETPLAISTHTSVSRPTVYRILLDLQKRGLVKKNIRNGKHVWSPENDRDVEQALYETKKVLLKFEEGKEEIATATDATVVLHRGGSAVKALLDSIPKGHKNERLYMIQGGEVTKGWERVYGMQGINAWNRAIRNNRIITEMIVPFKIFEQVAQVSGRNWAKEFEGRAATAHEIGGEYFQHGGQIFIFKKSLYLIAMNESVIIEVRNSEIQKLVLSMFQFIQDNSKKFDVNERLREIIAKEEVD